MLDLLKNASSCNHPFLVSQILYGLPVPVNKLPELSNLKRELENSGSSLRLLVDHPEQISKIQSFAKDQKTSNPWSVYVKVDPGYKCVAFI